MSSHRHRASDFSARQADGRPRSGRGIPWREGSGVPSLDRQPHPAAPPSPSSGHNAQQVLGAVALTVLLALIWWIIREKKKSDRKDAMTREVLS